VTRSGSVDFDRRLVELGVQNRRNNRETIRLITDVSGSLSSKWDYSTYATYGTFTQKQINLNEVNFQKAQWALDVESVGGVIQCRNADARADGCVPLNIFGEGSISKEAADYIRYTGHAIQTNEQFTGGGFVRGDLFDNWAGTIKLVAGAEYRWEGKHNIGDPDSEPGGLDGDPLTDDIDQTSLTPVEGIKASYDVWEVFGELDVPLVADMLDLQLAGRYADYSTVGGILSYNAGLVFRPIDGITFRGQYARSQRAPNLTEFFSSPRPDSDDLNDPCDGLQRDGTGLNPPSGPGGTDVNLATVAQNCLAEPGIQAYFADPANAGDPFNAPTSTQGPNAGNQNLKEETADSYTLGVVATPHFLGGLTLAVDYYRISIKDAIDSLSTQDTVDLCYASDDFPNNKFCDVITRNPADGSVDEVINVQENLSSVKVEGIDTTLLYRFEPGFVPGQFDIDLRYSHYFKNETKFVGLGGVVLTSTSLGEIESPRDELRFKLGYRYQDFRIAYTMTYVGGGLDDINKTDPTANDYFHVGGQDYHRIYASYDFGHDDQFRITAGVNNIFNDFGPLLPSGLNYGSSRNIVSNLNDSGGREFYVGLRARY
jgi:outer membrane receptor protein involved in Fe transport